MWDEAQTRFENSFGKQNAASLRVVLLDIAGDAAFTDRAEAHGFDNLSEYVRFLHNRLVEKVEQESTPEDYKARFPKKLLREFHRSQKVFSYLVLCMYHCARHHASRKSCPQDVSARGR